MTNSARWRSQMNDCRPNPPRRVFLLATHTDPRNERSHCFPMDQITDEIVDEIVKDYRATPREPGLMDMHALVRFVIAEVEKLVK